MSHTNHLQFSLCCHHNKIQPKDLQFKNIIKIKQIKIILPCFGKLFLQEQIHIKLVIRDRLKNSIKQLKCEILESITPEEFHLVEKIHKNSFKKYFGQKIHIWTFNELISKNKVTQGDTNIADKKKRVINKSFRQLTHIKSSLLIKGLNFSITLETLPKKNIIATLEDAVKDLEKEEVDPIHAKINLIFQNFKLAKNNLSKDEGNALKELESDT